MAENDGTEDDVDQGCCADRCTGACGGYGFAFELAARNLRDGTGHWAQLDGTCWDGCPVCAPAGDGTAVNRERRVTFIGQPSAGKSELAECCGERCDGTEEDLVFEGELPGFVGMLHTGRSDLARRAKDIARGRPVEDTP